jgi:hypothetical protein
MASHVSHIGVHDHGFNNISTYGNLLRLLREGKIPHNADEQNFYELALKVSGAVQAARWTKLADGTGFIHSFNGRTRCSWTPSVPAALWRWHTGSAMR